MLTFPLLLVIVASSACFLAPYFASQRLILPELVGDDEARRRAGERRRRGRDPRRRRCSARPLAGLLIAAFGAPGVLYVDAATFLFAFALLWLFVPRRPPLAPTDESRGVLAGVRFLLRDPLLRVARR